MEQKFGILTVSDSCFNGTGEDKSGPNLRNLLIKSGSFNISEAQTLLMCVPDEVNSIQEVLLKWVDEQRLSLILTTGGTGFSPRDVTPEATKAIIDREAPGLGIAMITRSLNVTPMAMLSRLVCGIRKNTLIVNLPGSKKGSQECLEFILPALPHALDLLCESKQSIVKTHRIIQGEGSTPHHICPHGHGGVAQVVSGGRTREDFVSVAKRPRQSAYPMLSVEDALKIIVREMPSPPPTMECDLHSALHSVLAIDVVSEQPLPPFPASIKDGYAVISSDGPGERQVLEPVTAGEESSVVITPGTVARITTGAPLPRGADAVVMVENTKLVMASDDGNEEKVVEILVSSKKGQDIRPIGCDISRGETVLEKGTVLCASEIGIAAAAGIDRLTVYVPPKVAVLSTGNEVVEPGAKLKPGQIYDSNRHSILALLKERSCSSIDLGVACDTREALVKQIANGLEQANVLITTGGVSMGEKDLLKPVLEKDFGAVIHFGRVFMKPGKPTTFATFVRNGEKKVIFGLPGNPVSAMVTFELFVFPALKKLAGWVETMPTLVTTKVSFPIQLDPRPEYYRVKLVWNPSEVLPIAMSLGSQNSSRLMSMRGANALLVLPPKTDQLMTIKDGDTVQAMLMHRSLY